MSGDTTPIWLLLALAAVAWSFLIVQAVRAFPIRKQQPHIHYGYSWDGYFEHCRCGVVAGDRLRPNGSRCIEFSEWDQ